MTNIPSDGNQNYISMACQVPLWEVIKRVPEGLQMNIEMKNSDGTHYGSHHMPLGHHCHQAADELRKLGSTAARINDAIQELQNLIDGGEECRGMDSAISRVIAILDGTV